MPLSTISPGRKVTVESRSSSTWLESMGAIVALVVMAVYAFTVVAPYYLAPNTANPVIELIRSNKSTVDLITTAVVMFYFGASVGRRKDQDTMHTLAQTNAAQTDAILPTPDADAIPVAVGETRTIVGQEHTP